LSGHYLSPFLRFFWLCPLLPESSSTHMQVTQTMKDNTTLIPAAETTHTLAAQVIAGCTGGTLIALFVTPFDVVKTRLQGQLSPGVLPSLKYKGSMDACRQIVKAEGVTALWTGGKTALVMTLPRVTTYFTLYDWMYSYLKNKELRFAAALAGLSSRVITACLISPLEYVRTYQQAAPHTKNRGIFKIFSTIINNGGVSSLWRGLGVTLVRDVPFSGIYWSGYEKFTLLLQKHFDQKRPSFAVSFASGAASGVIASVVTQPIDVIKTHKQMYITNVNILGTFQIGLNIKKVEGWSGLFAGTLPRLAKVAPACAIMISTYEFVKRQLNQKSILH